MRPNRIDDPMNYREACFWIVYKNMYSDQRVYCEDMDTERLFSWLGSNAGQYFLRDVNELIDEYPYKRDCAIAIICGEVADQSIVDNHLAWIESKLR